MQAGDTIALIVPRSDADPHGTLRVGIDTYRAAFEKIGYRTRLFDLAAMDRAMVDALRSPRIRLLFSDGGWVHTVLVDTAEGRRPLADELGKPVVMLINDSPCSHWMGPILDRDRPGQTTAFLDPDFATLWSRWADKAGTHQLYVPACPRLPPKEGERTIERLVVVSLRDPEHYRRFILENSRDPRFVQAFEGIADLGLSGVSRPFSALCDEVCRSLGIMFDYRSEGIRIFLYATDYYIRNRRRQIMLDRLSGHPITLVGGGSGFRMHPDSRVIAPLPHRKLLALYRRARCTVVSPPYAGGISERVTHAMAAGSLVVSPPTALSDRLLGRDRYFVTAAGDFSDLAACLDRAADPALRQDMAAQARTHASRRFSPVATVRRFLGTPDADPL